MIFKQTNHHFFYYIRNHSTVIPPHTTPDCSLPPLSEWKLSQERILYVINNQYDGGGHEIGEHLAKELNIPLYDRTIIDQTARELEYSAEYIKRKEQSTSNMELLKMIFADSSGMLPEMK